MIYSRRLRVEQKKDRRNTILYVVFSVVALILLFRYGVANAAKLIGFVGDFKNASTTFEQDDKTPPPPPSLDNIPRATHDTNLKISGSTEAGVIVILTLNGQEGEILSNSEGRFIFEFALNDGENTISAKAKDKAGNESVQSTIKKVFFDNKAPELEITEPIDGASFFGAKQKQLILKGKTDDGAKVQVNGRWVITNTDGSFNYVYGLGDGDNELTVTSEDDAGNKTEKKLKVTFIP